MNVKNPSDDEYEEPGAKAAPGDDADDDLNSAENLEVLEKAKKLKKTDAEHWNPIFEKGRDDLDFLSDDDECQWPTKEYNDRVKTGRPALTVDYLTQFVHQVANNIRMNTPSINPIPGDDKSVADADMVKGLIKKIEYDSRADEVYDTGATSAIKCSIGFARVDHDYVDERKGFEQKLIIQRVINQFMIFMDCTTIESDGSDQNHCTILEKIRVSKFKSEYPGCEPTSFEDDQTDKEYKDEDEITLAEFFIKSTEEEEITATDTKGKATRRKVKRAVINRYKFSGTEVLSKTTFPGSYIPIVPFYGEEAWQDGKRHLLSLIRKSKQAQYMFNLMQSVEAEILMKQPIAPVMVAAGAIENYADDWLNPSKSMALRFDSHDAEGNELPTPQRLSPAVIPAGVVNMGREAVDNIKATMGLYNTSIGAQANEVSGKAIDARKIQGDIATYHFGDNTVRAITQIGRIIVSAMPEIYDTERVVGIIDGEDKPKHVGINGAKVDGQKETHNLNSANFDVRVITGNSYATMRQESAAFYQDLMKQSPEMMKVGGDLMFKNMDVQGAQEMAARMRKIIDPKLLQDDDDSQDPQVMALTQQLQQAQQIIQQGAQQMQQLQQQLQEKNAGVQAKAQNDAEKNQLTMMKTQLDAQAKKMDQFVAMMNLMLKARQLDITEQNNAGNLALKADAQQDQSLLGMMQAITAALPQTELPGEPGDTAANNGAVNSGVE